MLMAVKRLGAAGRDRFALPDFLERALVIGLACFGFAAKMRRNVVPEASDPPTVRRPRVLTPEEEP